MTRFLISLIAFLSIMATFPRALADVIVGETNFATLISQHARGQVARTPWIGYSWPYQLGGLSASPLGLSPAEKYDAAYRAYLYSRGIDQTYYEPLAIWETDHHGLGLGNAQAWQAHDLGWAVASVLYAEPTKDVHSGGVQFTAHDIKALLAELAGDAHGTTYGQMVKNQADLGSAKGRDVSPNQFFLALTNLIGKAGQNIVIDRNPGIATAHVPLVGYAIDYPAKANYLGKHPQYRNIYRIKLNARVWWANNVLAPVAQTPKFDMPSLYNRFDDPYFPGTIYQFELWLDAPVVFSDFGQIISAGNVVQLPYGAAVMGGEWIKPLDPALAEYAHPDYMLLPTAVSPIAKARNPRLDAVWLHETFIKPLKLLKSAKSR